jgi:DNA-binding NarL/FixJ family response regulator
MHTNEAYVRTALQSGAKAYILKHALKDELLNAIRTVFRGEVFLSPQVVGAFESTSADDTKSKASLRDRLTPREREILQLVGEGNSAQEIAIRLVISPKTVERHKANLMQKLGIHSTPALVRLAIELGLVQVDQLQEGPSA